MKKEKVLIVTIFILVVIIVVESVCLILALNKENSNEDNFTKQEINVVENVAVQTNRNRESEFNYNSIQSGKIILDYKDTNIEVIGEDVDRIRNFVSNIEYDSGEPIEFTENRIMMKVGNVYYYFPYVNNGYFYVYNNSKWFKFKSEDPIIDEIRGDVGFQLECMGYIKLSYDYINVTDSGSTMIGKIQKEDEDYKLEMYESIITIAGPGPYKLKDTYTIKSKVGLKEIIDKYEPDKSNILEIEYKVSCFYIPEGDDTNLTIDELGNKLFE